MQISISKKIFLSVAFLGLFALTSCHRTGCPNQITDVDKSIEKTVVCESFTDENC